MKGLNPYYTGSTLWAAEEIALNNLNNSLNPYYTGSTLWDDKFCSRYYTRYVS